MTTLHFTAAHACVLQVWTTFAPVATYAIEYYDTNSWGINGLTMLFSCTYLATAFPAAYCLAHYGIRKSMILGATLNAIGRVATVGFVGSA